MNPMNDPLNERDTKVEPAVPFIKQMYTQIDLRRQVDKVMKKLSQVKHHLLIDMAKQPDSHLHFVNVISYVSHTFNTKSKFDLEIFLCRKKG